jgi:protocatechuate 3,4-dioxygenase beta subunit
MSEHHGPHDELEDHDLGLSHDLPRIVERQRLARRGMLAIFGGVGIAALAGCATDSSSSSSTASDGTAGGPPNGAPPNGGGGMGGDSSVEVADGEIPEETAGPYPGDGSNGPNVLAESGVVRSDITSSFGDASGVAEGVPMTVKLKVYDLNGDDATPLAGAAVYLWHCDREGEYSLYSQNVTDQNYLRGVQVADDAGSLGFTSIYPGAYSGRWPHIHFEVFSSLDDATSGSGAMTTSQIALLEDVSADVYAGASGYSQSVTNLARTSLDSDMVFRDGASLQLPTMSGDIDAGIALALTFAV